MTDKTFGILLLITTITMIGTVIYMFTKSFSAMLNYSREKAKEIEIREVQIRCLEVFNQNKEKVGIIPEIYKLKNDLQEEVVRIGKLKGYAYIDKNEDVLIFKKNKIKK
jgi:hypothetical protein